jgi:SAM-dependent methyltransferase
MAAIIAARTLRQWHATARENVFEEPSGAETHSVDGRVQNLVSFMILDTLRLLKDWVRRSTPPRLWFQMRRLRQLDMGNRLFDLRYGVKTSGLKLTTDAVTGLPGVEYRPTPLKLLRRMMQLPQKYRLDYQQYTFIDIGCGKGAALLMAARHPYRRIIGVEYSPEFYEITQQNIRCFKSAAHNVTTIEVVLGEASRYQFPAAPTVLYMFNPFRGEVMTRLMQNLQQSLDASPRPLFIIYHRPYQSAIVETLRGIRMVERATVDLYNFYAVNG